MQSTGSSEDGRGYACLFRFVCENVRPSEITAQLNLEPSKEYLPQGEPKRPRYPYWGIGTERPSQTALEEQLSSLVGLLEARKDALENLAKAGVVGEFYCGVFAGEGELPSIWLSPELIRRIDSLRAGCRINLYP